MGAPAAWRSGRRSASRRRPPNRRASSRSGPRSSWASAAAAVARGRADARVFARGCAQRADPRASLPGAAACLRAGVCEKRALRPVAPGACAEAVSGPQSRRPLGPGPRPTQPRARPRPSRPAWRPRDRPSWERPPGIRWRAALRARGVALPRTPGPGPSPGRPSPAAQRPARRTPPPFAPPPLPEAEAHPVGRLCILRVVDLLGGHSIDATRRRGGGGSMGTETERPGLTEASNANANKLGGRRQGWQGRMRNQPTPTACHLHLPPVRGGLRSSRSGRRERFCRSIASGFRSRRPFARPRSDASP